MSRLSSSEQAAYELAGKIERWIENSTRTADSQFQIPEGAA